MRKQEALISLIAIIVLFVFCFGVVFPNYFNQAISFLNSKAFAHLGLTIPEIPQVPFKLGLDLQGGSHLVYEADLSNVAAADKEQTMQGLRDLIERRINYFGVKEPIVMVERKGEHQRLVVDLAGVTNVEEAIEMIGGTPFLEFREERTEEETEQILDNLEITTSSDVSLSLEDAYFKPTELTGKYLKKSQLDFNQTTFEPEVLLEFNEEGARIFEELTARNIDKKLAIYIDDVLISAPVVREAISGGKAQITGQFTVNQARELVRNLNAGALPVPISLISQTTVGPTLGKISLQKSLKAGLYGFLAIVLFMILYYRFSGFLATLALTIYALILLSLFKLFPVTLTLAGIGGAILSVGMAIDANVLVFERQKEERKAGESFSRALTIGFSRAWPSIRDGNFTTIIIALLMFSFGTSFVKGFALTLILGILISIFSALFITRVFLSLFAGTKLENHKRLWS